MYLLRRTAARAISAPSRALCVKPRSITSITPASFRSRQQQWNIPMLQRRFATDEATKSTTAESAAEEAGNFAQTAPEAPVDENLTPAQDAPVTSGIDALDQAVEEDGRPFTRPLNNSTPPSTNVYVGNLYYEVTEEQLERVFSRFGAISTIKIIKDNRGLSRGFAYVTFEDVKDAEAAVQNLDMQVFEGRNLVVQFHKPRVSERRFGGSSATPNPPSKTLFIGNMSFEMSDKDLNDLFRDIRNVTDVRVAIDRRTGQPRGFAHADFVNEASATKAKELLSNKVIYGRQLRIDYSSSGTKQQGNRRRGDELEGDSLQGNQ